MRHNDCRIDRWLLPAALALALAVPMRASAQEGAIVEAPAPEQPQFIYSDENFNQWVFGVNRNPQAARSRLDSLLTVRMEDADRACTLTDAQKAKLRLAGRGDLKHYFDKVDLARKRFELVRSDQNKINEFLQEIQPLTSIANAGPFADGSLFAKTLARTLTPAQTAGYQEMNRDRKKFRYRAKVDLLVVTLDNVVGLRDDQRKRFVKLLLDETRPAKREGPYDYYVLMYQVSKLPEAKLKPLFDDAQWRKLNAQLAQMNGIEQFLRTNNFLPDDEPAAAKGLIPNLPLNKD